MLLMKYELKDDNCISWKFKKIDSEIRKYKLKIRKFFSRISSVAERNWSEEHHSSITHQTILGIAWTIYNIKKKSIKYKFKK